MSNSTRKRNTKKNKVDKELQKGKRKNCRTAVSRAKEVDEKSHWFKMICFIILFTLSIPMLLKTNRVEDVKEEEEENNEEIERSENKQKSRYVVLETLPHDPTAFTQGLTFLDGKLYESTGLNGESQVRQLDPTNGQVIQSINMKDEYFGEGMTCFQYPNGTARLMQLTWKNRVGFIYDMDTLNVLMEFRYDTVTSEGWGITYNPYSAQFIVSDGSEWLYFWDRDTLEEKRRVQVMFQITATAEKQPIPYINELEFVSGFVLANVWYQNVIIAIDPNTGMIVNVLDFSTLYTNRTQSADVFNGISQTGVDGELFVTGKLWPHLYRIKVL